MFDYIFDKQLYNAHFPAFFSAVHSLKTECIHFPLGFRNGVDMLKPTTTWCYDDKLIFCWTNGSENLHYKKFTVKYSYHQSFESMLMTGLNQNNISNKSVTVVKVKVRLMLLHI